MVCCFHPGNGVPCTTVPPLHCPARPSVKRHQTFPLISTAPRDIIECLTLAAASLVGQPLQISDGAPKRAGNQNFGHLVWMELAKTRRNQLCLPGARLDG